MDFNKKEFSLFKSDVETALKEVEKKHGVSISCGNIRYSELDFTLQLTVIKSDASTDGKKQLFEKECVYYGFEPEEYNKLFTLNGKAFRLVGFNRNSPKNCCKIISETDGKEYKCNAEAIHRAFKDN